MEVLGELITSTAKRPTTPVRKVSRELPNLNCLRAEFEFTDPVERVYKVGRRSTMVASSEWKDDSL